MTKVGPVIPTGHVSPPPSRIYTTSFPVEKSVSIYNAAAQLMLVCFPQRSGSSLSPHFPRVSSFPGLCRPPVTPLRSALISHRCACASARAGTRNHSVLKGRSALLRATRRRSRPHAHTWTLRAGQICVACPTQTSCNLLLGTPVS